MSKDLEMRFNALMLFVQYTPQLGGVMKSAGGNLNRLAQNRGNWIAERGLRHAVDIKIG